MVAHKALLFGEFSAKAAGENTFDDPVMHNYFLHYIFGAVKALATSPELPTPLDEEDSVNAMGAALMTFEGSTREDVMGALRVLYRANDAATLRIQDEGRAAAGSWDGSEGDDSVFRFLELMKDEANFPREVAESPPLATPPDGD